MMLKRFIVGITGAAVFAGASFAQDGPSYEETVNYISENTRYSPPTHAGWVGTRTTTLRFVGRCQIEYTKRDNSRYPRVGSAPATSQNWEEEWNVQLNEIDPREIHARERSYGQNYIILNTTGRRDLLPHIYRNFEENEVRRNLHRSVSIDVRNRDKATRLARAFSHLVELCGGEEELF